MRRRLTPLAALAGVAMVVHVAALGGARWAWPERAVTPPPPATMRVRVLETPAPVARAAAGESVAPEWLSMPSQAAAGLPLPAGSLKTRPLPAPPVRAAVRRVASVVEPVDVPVDVRPADGARETLYALAENAPSPAPAEGGPFPISIGDEAIPHYRTRMPPAALLRYDLQRGGLHGSGELLWRPAGDHYELRLEGRVGPLSVLTQVSAGGFDVAGLAPTRFTDKRLRRPTAAANFQRDAGKVTFSGPSTEFALQSGTQDRLSWMLQLAAIAAAEPTLRSAGAKVAMGVIGAHAEASVWTFRCVGREAVDTGAGSVDAIKYVREPREAYDTTVQVWLDPAQHFLPVHATQKSGSNDEGFSLRLQALTAPP